VKGTVCVSSREGEVPPEGNGERLESSEPAGIELGPEPSISREIVAYLAMVLSLIEGREVSFREVKALLYRAWRQHSIARRRGLDYAVWYLNNRSP
jgi:hypothetical protein